MAILKLLWMSTQGRLKIADRSLAEDLNVGASRRLASINQPQQHFHSNQYLWQGAIVDENKHSPWKKNVGIQIIKFYFTQNT